jgi:hypothetical protein
MTFESGVPEDFRMVFLRDQVGLLPVEAFPDVAADLLVRGCDSPALREVAGHPRNDPRGTRDLWAIVREELGIPDEDDAEARWILVRDWTSRIVDGSLDPVEGARAILGCGWFELGQPEELTGFLALMDDWDEMPSRRTETKTRLIAMAREVLDGLPKKP